MKIIISSAKTMKETNDKVTTLPAMLKMTEELLGCLEEKDINELKEIWDVSDNKTIEYKRELEKMDLYFIRQKTH